MARQAGVRIIGTFDDYKLRIFIEKDFEDVELTPTLALNLINETSQALRVILNDRQSSVEASSIDDRPED